MKITTLLDAQITKVVAETTSKVLFEYRKSGMTTQPFVDEMMRMTDKIIAIIKKDDGVGYEVAE